MKKYYLLVCYVNKKSLLEKILGVMFELGAGGATVIKSFGIGRSQVEDAMLFTGFKDLINKSTEKDHFTIHCIIPSSLKEKITKKLTSTYGNFKDPSVGLFSIITIDEVYGLSEAR
ncbi:TPA: hypothetical protein DCZ32_01760 [Candidatus Uhrbacteria bacterium]|nr:hypothetical protein [Candidatus Uhrbacteria bacterium]